MPGGALSLVGAGQSGGKTNWGKISKTAAAVASPMVMMGEPEMAPVAAELGAYAGSGKKARRTKKTLDMAAQIPKSPRSSLHCRVTIRKPRPSLG